MNTVKLKLKGNSRFNMEQVKALREAYFHKERPRYMTMRYLAALHNVSTTCMERLLGNVTYVDKQ